MTSYESCFPYIYYIQLDKVERTNKKGKTEVINIINRWAGTGFLLSDGRFVTSRRIIERWYFQVNGNLMDEDMRPLNKAVCNLERVVAYLLLILLLEMRWLSRVISSPATEVPIPIRFFGVH